MERIGHTAVLGELLAGVIVGPGVLGLVHESEVLHALAQLGCVSGGWCQVGKSV